MCQKLKLGGKGGWRLPMQLELESLLEKRGSNKRVHPALARMTPEGWYWTASLQTDGSPTVWTIGFPNGYPGTSSLTSLQRVRCVR